MRLSAAIPPLLVALGGTGTAQARSTEPTELGEIIVTGDMAVIAGLGCQLLLGAGLAAFALRRPRP